ncbi:MAG: radical SAM protein [Planctomycetota bacterium]|nr:radical SAM protein [Planctomycetota bacterium]
MLLYSIHSPKKDLKSMLADSDAGIRLNEMLHSELGEEASSEFENILKLTNDHPYDIVHDSIQRSVDANEPRFPFVQKQLFNILDEIAPRYNFCSGGRTAVEINANGDYARCLRYAEKQTYMGNLFEDGHINLIDVESDTEAQCNLYCKRRMCYARNTIRSESREEFDNLIAAKGLIGDYRKSRRNRKADIFIRWKITETCNYTCSYCTAWKTVNKKLPEMPTDRLIEAAEIFLNQFDNISLRLTGGEPAVKKNYVELMEYFHSRLDKFVEIELRTNFSFPEKQKKVFALDWQDKLHYHIGCHVYDKNFRPWDFVDILSRPTSVDYVVKFVSSASNKKYVDRFIDYFKENGISPEKILVVHDIRDSAEDSSRIPPAILKMDSGKNFSEYIDDEEGPGLPMIQIGKPR